MSIHEDRRALVDEKRAFVLEQIEHIRKHGYSFSEWVVLFLLVDPEDEGSMKLARLFGWRDGASDLLMGLVRRDELCAAMRAHKISGSGIVEQDIQPGRVRCVVFDRGVGLVDVDAPLSSGN